MSPQNSSGRKPVLVAGAAGSVAVAMVVGIGVAVADDAGEPATERYIVQLADPPAASYDGGIAGFAATAPDDGDTIDVHDQAVRRYQTRLADQRADVLADADVESTVHEYDLVYNGFAADLTDAQVADLAADESVLAVHPDTEYHADTSTTPAFLGLAGDDGAWSERFGGPDAAGEGVIVGVIDSGIWPEHPSFAALPEPRPDQDVIDAKWNGECVAGDEADPADNVTCNNKVIGARYYPDGVDMVDEEFASPRDYHGHGSNVSGIAAGNHDVDAGSWGSVSGMAPSARIATYKACWRVSESGCRLLGSNGVAAIEDAVADGVDVINYSISGSLTTAFDAIHEAYLHAAAAGVFVATSGGNTGPDAGTIGHSVPWMTTVASGTHDRDADVAPELAGDSAVGPAELGSGDLLKPDVLAQGVSIRAAQSPAGSSSGSEFGSWSGTSMASPHVAGVAALLIGANPDWSPMTVKSALMTTATDLDNSGSPIQRDGVDAGPMDYGSGQIVPGDAFDPGLVYESDEDQWWQYGCGLGEVTDTVCDELGVIDVSDVNYPSIAVGGLSGSQTVIRTVTNVSDSTLEFTATVDAPDGIEVDLSDTVLSLAPGDSASFEVTFADAGGSAGEFAFGTLTWESSAGHVVASPLAIQPV